MKFLSFLLIVFTTLTYAQESSQDLNQTEEFTPIQGLFSVMYENSLGPSFTMGLLHNYSDDSRSPIYRNFTGPYVEVGLGTHGANVDIGVIKGSSFAESAAISLSYFKIFNHTGYYPLGDYYGVNARISFMFLILRLGLHRNTVTNEKKANIGIGFGF